MSSTNIQTYIDRAVQLEAEIAAAKEQLEEAKIKIQTELYSKNAKLQSKLRLCQLR